MKNLIAFCFLVILLSCSNNAEQEALRKEIASLRNENNQLKNNQRKQETSITAYKRSLEEIDFNLKKIALNWALIHDLEIEGDTEKDVQGRIKNRINFIDNIISNTNLKIQLLDKNLDKLRKDSDSKSDEILQLDRSLKNSARTLIEREQEHNQKRQALELEIEDLEKVYQEQKAYTEELRQMLNRAYYYTGSAKDLKAQKIVDNAGGFIGIGKVKILNAQKDISVFNQIEKDKTTQLSISASQIKLITNHPKNSFKIQPVNGSTKLTIIDKKEFWKAGNYLIIQTN